MKAIKTTFLAVGISCLAFLAEAQELTGHVTNVLDGNTVELLTAESEKYTILLHGIDSPEPGQNYHAEAKKMLEKLLLDKYVVVALFGRDRTGNRLGLITVGNNPDPRHELVKAGLAWTTEKDPAAELEEMKEQARMQGKGLWRDENPVPPWTYRRQQTMSLSKSSE